MATRTRSRDKSSSNNSGGFTFAELLVVMTIITILMAVTLPYVTRSSKALQLQQETANLETVLRMLIEQATHSQRPTRLVVDTQQQSYRLEQASNSWSENFKPLDGALGQIRFLGRPCSFGELDGFQSDAGQAYLLFDPLSLWPQAALTLISEQGARMIQIKGPHIGNLDLGGLKDAAL